MASKYGNLMDEFAQWGTNIKFNSALEEWMRDNCEGFEDAEFGGEQKQRTYFFIRIHTQIS